MGHTIWGHGPRGIVVIMAFVGCSDADLPLDALSVRDALQVAPEAMAALSTDARARLAVRLDPLRAPRSLASDEAETAWREGPVVVGMALRVRTADDARATRAWDALRSARVVHDGPRWALAPLDLSVAMAQAPNMATPLRVEDPATGDTAEAEARALEGRGGVLLRAALTATGATRIVRVVSWPVGLVHAGDTVFVNAGWLLAVSADATETAAVAIAPTEVPQPVATGARTDQHVAELRGNTYRPYGSLGACVRDVRSRCADCVAGGTCDARAALRDFSDSRAECVWLLGDADGGVSDAGVGPADRVSQLCLASMLSMPHVRTCLTQAGACGATGAIVNQRDDLPALALQLADGACRAAVDRCLGGGDATLGEGAFRCGGGSCEAPLACREPCTTPGCSGDSSSSGCGGCSSSSGSSGSSGCSGCSGSSSSSGSCRGGGCRVLPPHARRVSPWALWSEWALSIAPLAWLLSQSRRRP